MDQKSPEFRVGAFVQDIENLRSTLDMLGIMYRLKKTKIEIKDAGKYHNEIIGIPEFQLHQFLGRVCMMLEDLQARFTAPDNEGLIPSCHIHGAKPPVVVVEDKAICLLCLADGPFAKFVCNWVDPEDEMPEQEKELS